MGTSSPAVPNMETKLTVPLFIPYILKNVLKKSDMPDKAAIETVGRSNLIF